MIIDWNDEASVTASSTYCHHAVGGGTMTFGTGKIGITSGCFDLFHFYHLQFLEKCKRLCNVLIVGVDSDSLVKTTKGDKRPIFPEKHRLNIINALKCVDLCFIMDSLKDFDRAVFEFANEDNNGIIFKNDDWFGKEEEIIGFNPDQRYPTSPFGKKIKDGRSNVIIIPDIEEISSTTEFIKKIQSLY
jgi:cytidyltransferase-like protein